jgi:tetratricopeptide (TPR) repeat protein
MQPDYDYAIYVRTRVLVALGRLDDAMRSAEHLIRLTPHASRAYRSRALIYERLGEEEKHLGDLETALTLDDDADPELMNQKGLCLNSLGRYEEALVCFEQCLSINSNDYSAAYNAAIAVVKSRGAARGQDEIQRAESCLKANAPEGPRLYGFAGLAAVQGDRETAVMLYDAAFIVDPTVSRWTRRDVAWNDLRGTPEFQDRLRLTR